MFSTFLCPFTFDAAFKTFSDIYTVRRLRPAAEFLRLSPEDLNSVKTENDHRASFQNILNEIEDLLWTDKTDTKWLQYTVLDIVKQNLKLSEYSVGVSVEFKMPLSPESGVILLLNSIRSFVLIGGWGFVCYSWVKSGKKRVYLLYTVIHFHVLMRTYFLQSKSITQKTLQSV